MSGIDGSQIPAWGMFALALVYIAFQFILKWHATQTKKAENREGGPKAAEAAAFAQIVTALGSVTQLLDSMNAELGRVADQTDELHRIHLGPKALDDDNRPKWWGDREEMRHMRESIDTMNRRLAWIERSMPQAATRPRSADSVGDLAPIRDPRET